MAQRKAGEKNFWLFISLLFGFLLATSMYASAGELRIVDNHGLVRSVQDIHTQAAIVITVRGEGVIRLSNENGLAPDIEGEPHGDESYLFRSVPEGRWRITTTDPKAVISQVKVDSSSQ